MKKILVAFNVNSYSNSLAQFAISLAQKTSSSLHALFVTPSLAPLVQFPFPTYGLSTAGGLLSASEIAKETKETLEIQVRIFEEQCEASGVTSIVEGSGNIGLNNLVDHSAFSDLVLCSAKEELDGISTRELLIDTHAPVLLVPEKMSMPSKVIICYDESFSSILAMKMFSYLLPEWKEFPTVLLTINPKDDSNSKHEEYLSDWMPHHFPNVERQVFQGDMQKALKTFITGVEPAIVVMGAYGGNAMSRLFHRSLANIVIEETNAFVFVMHE
jgi:nucleotide-binding universal stress UspA family protein